jgi:hypothetical protein
VLAATGTSGVASDASMTYVRLRYGHFAPVRRFAYSGTPWPFVKNAAFTIRRLLPVAASCALAWSIICRATLSSSCADAVIAQSRSRETKNTDTFRIQGSLLRLFGGAATK